MSAVGEQNAKISPNFTQPGETEFHSPVLYPNILPLSAGGLHDLLRGLAAAALRPPQEVDGAHLPLGLGFHI